MKVHELRCAQQFPHGVDETFSFFKDPANLSRITPPWLSFSIRTGNPLMRAGAEIDYTIKWLGLPLRWRTRITEYEPPFHFVDTQLEGPYRLWEHRHTFQPAGDGTLVTDLVRYALPFGPLGGVAHGLIVRRQLAHIFRRRQGALAAILGGNEGDYPEISNS